MQSVEPVKTIFVASTPRTGSTYLCTVMAETEKLGKPHEYFNVTVAFPDAASISQRYEYARKNAVTKNGAFSAKLYPKHWNNVCKALDVEQCFPNRYWIWLRRRDLLAQAVSLHIALQTRAWVSSMTPVKEPEYSAIKIHNILKSILINNSMWELFFIKNNIEPYHVYYEDLVNDTSSVITGIAKYVDEQIRPESIKLTTHIKSQNSSLNIKWKEQYLEDIKDVGYMDKVTSGNTYSLSLKNLILLLTGKLQKPL